MPGTSWSSYGRCCGGQMVRGEGLSVEIVRSKTTGAGKKIDVQRFYVSKDAYS